MSIVRMARIGMQSVAAMATGRKTLPLATLLPSFACNLRCGYCNLPQLRDKEQPVEFWLEMVDRLAAEGCRRISIMGGEPLLFAGLPQLLERCRQRDVCSVVVTNGQLIPARLDWLQRADRLVISMDAANASMDEVRGEGAFEGVLRGLEAVELLRRQGLVVSLNSVLTTSTRDCLPGLLAFARERGLSLSVNIVRSGNAHLYKDSHALQLEHGAMLELLEELRRIASRERLMRFSPGAYETVKSWPDFSKDMITNKEQQESASLRNWPRCNAGRRFMAVKPDGTAVPCMPLLEKGPAVDLTCTDLSPAMDKLQQHGCHGCSAPCMLEINRRLNLHPAALWHALRVRGEG